MVHVIVCLPSEVDLNTVRNVLSNQLPKDHLLKDVNCHRPSPSWAGSSHCSRCSPEELSTSAAGAFNLTSNLHQQCGLWGSGTSTIAVKEEKNISSCGWFPKNRFRTSRWLTFVHDSNDCRLDAAGQALNRKTLDDFAGFPTILLLHAFIFGTDSFGFFEQDAHSTSKEAKLWKVTFCCCFGFL